MKRVMFVVMPYHISVPGHSQIAYTAFPYGVLSIATYIEDIADVRIFDCNISGSMMRELEEFQPDIVAISMMFDVSLDILPLVVADIKRAVPNAKIVVGGMAATGSYNHILDSNQDIEAVCYYEGEIAVRDLVVTGACGCKAWVTRENRNPQKVSVQTLDDVIDIDYSLIEWEKYGMREAFSPHAGKIKDPRQFYVVSSRGCPFSCTFCMHSADPDKTIRYASADAVVNHIKRLIEMHGCNIVTFFDDQFLLDKKRAMEILQGLEGLGLRIEFPNGLSTAFIDDGVAKCLSEAGADTVYLAIESGSPRVLKDLIKKPLRLEQVKPAVDALRKYGIWCMGFFVTGYPDETDDDRRMTMQLIKDCDLDWSRFSPVCPLRGTALYNECVAKGYIPKDAEIDMNRYIINTEERTSDDLVRKTDAMNIEANFINNRAMRIGDYETAIHEFKAVIDRDPGHLEAWQGLADCAEAIWEKEEG